MTGALLPGHSCLKLKKGVLHRALGTLVLQAGNMLP